MQGPAGPAGSGHGYFAENGRRISSRAPFVQELVGLSELPAGSYLVSYTVYVNDGFEGISGGNTSLVLCDLRASGVSIGTAQSVMDEESAGSTDRGALSGVGAATLAANGSLIVHCGIGTGDPPLAHGRITALRVDGLN